MDSVSTPSADSYGGGSQGWSPGTRGTRDPRLEVDPDPTRTKYSPVVVGSPSLEGDGQGTVCYIPRL